ncbi:MAG: GUN4 domain-containing protein [Snowella sp.]|nr:GUN4 domain-containing protein [Snowella sp.]
MTYIIGFLFGVVITVIFFVIRQRKILQKLKDDHTAKLESELRYSQDEHSLELQSLQKQHELEIQELKNFNEIQLKKQATITFVETLVKIWTNSELINSLTVTYAPLKNYLSNKEWEKADQETATLILNDCNAKNSYLEIEEITSLSPELLLTIDSLWLYYSQNCFGFSIQLEMLNNYNSSIPLIEEEWRKIGCLLGWNKNGAWISGYNQLNFSQNAPRGQFPFFVLWKGTFWGNFIDSQSSRFTSLMRRFSDCKPDFR